MESEEARAEVVIVGIGQMAGVLSFGLLRLGHPVIPVTRSMSMAETSLASPTPARVIVAVGEDDLESVLSETPLVWRDRLVLLQNELRPASWQSHAIIAPTILCAWFEKKRGIELRSLRPSVVIGPGASLLSRALEAAEVPTLIGAEETLPTELAKKNLYISTVNIAGLVADLSVGELWRTQAKRVSSIFDELFQIEAKLLDAPLDRHEQERSLEAVIEAAPERRARGRTAPARLHRSLKAAARLGLVVPSLQEISNNL